MNFLIELEKTEKGLVFKLREGKPLLVEARSVGKPFDMTFEDRPYGAGYQYGGSPRYGNFVEQLDDELKKRLSLQIANSFLLISSEREVSKRETLYSNGPPIVRPRIVTQNIQLYSIDETKASKQRDFTRAFVATWAR